MASPVVQEKPWGTYYLIPNIQDRVIPTHQMYKTVLLVQPPFASGGISPP